MARNSYTLYKPRFLALVLFVFTLIQGLFAAPKTYSIDERVLKADDLPRMIDTEKGVYLLMALPFEPVSQLRLQIEAGENVALLHRGEAHITVIVRREFEILSPFIDFNEMNRIASEMNIQSSRFEIRGLGRGSAMVEGKQEHTYFIVVHSEDLLKIRRRLHSVFIERGGDRSKFSPEDFHSHITVGYTRHDLQPRDGVHSKDCSTIIAGLSVVN